MLPGVEVISYGQQVLENGQKVRLCSCVQCRVKQNVEAFLRITCYWSSTDLLRTQI